MNQQNIRDYQALCVVANVQQGNIIKQLLKENKQLLKENKELKKKYYNLQEDMWWTQEWMESYGYDEDYDIDRRDNGREPLFHIYE